MKYLTPAAFAALGMIVVAPAHAQTKSNLSAVDQAFLKEAAPGNQAEVVLGTLASQRSENEAVKEFGRWMASSHGFAGRELATVLQHMHGQTVSTTLTSEQSQMMQKLQGLSGADFDRAYMTAMVEDHQQDVKKFEQEAQGGHDPMIRTFAQNLVPSLREHLAEAQDLQRDLTNPGVGNAGQAAHNAAGAAGTAAPAQ